jgi:hypothetical protein
MSGLLGQSSCDPAKHPTKGTRRPKPLLRGTLMLVEVSCLPRQTNEPQSLCLWRRGTGAPDLAVIWRADVPRFDLEHPVRFFQQTLKWTLPRLLDAKDA